MHGISYKLTLLEPVLVNSSEGDNNTAVSYLFVPGAVVRGAVIRVYQAQHNLEELNAAEEQTRRLFFEATTRYLHAYPYAEADRQRSLPVPLSWHKLKEAEVQEKPPITLYDFSLTADDSHEQWQTLKGRPFCVLLGEAAYQVDGLHRLNVHTQRDALPGRATEQHGAIYRYEAIAAGTVLSGVILTETPEDAEALQNLLTGRTLYLGKARTAGYGQVRVTDVAMLPPEWTETSGMRVALSDDAYETPGDEMEPEEPNDEAAADTPQTAPATTSFTLTFLSDAIVRDDNGQYTLDPIPALRRRLQLEKQVTLATKAKGAKGRDLVFRRAEIVGGFNRKWGLPLPQVTAIAAGSVFVINAEPAIPRDALDQLEETGIGERRTEGFGRVAIDWHMSAELSYSKLKAETDVEGTLDQEGDTALNEQERRLAAQFLHRLLCRDLDQLLREAVARLRIDGTVPNSQLGRWRSLIRSASAAGGVARLTNFYAKEETRASSAWDRMWRARVKDTRGAGRSRELRLAEWINDILTKEDALTTYLTPQLPERALGQTVKATVTKELAEEYRLRLLDGVLARKAKEQSHANASGGRHV